MGLVFNITDKSSLEELEFFNDEVDRYCQENAVKLLIGSKADLLHNRVITIEEARLWAKEHNCCSYIEASAKSGANVNEIFRLLVEEVLLQRKKISQNTLSSAVKKEKCGLQ